MEFQPLARQIFDAAIEAVSPIPLIREALRLDPADKNRLVICGEVFRLDHFERLHVLGAGKGAVDLYRGLRERIGNRPHGGMIVSPEPHGFDNFPGKADKGNREDTKSDTVRFLSGSHPLPGEDSERAGKAMMEYIDQNVGTGDLVFFLLTGGASSLLAAPHPPLQLEDKTAVTRLLLASGASIEEINCIRKHLSALKGGRLAERIQPARIISLILSDIVDSPLESIGSGPTVGDTSTFADACSILTKYSLWEGIPRRAKAFLETGRGGGVPETPLPGSTMFANNRCFLLGDNLTALKGAHKCALELGIPTYILTSRDNGEAADAAKFYGAIIKEIKRSSLPFEPPVLLLSGGELTVDLRKGKSSETGKGGRNQEFILALWQQLKGETGAFYAASIGSDGIDGPTDAAGAWIDHFTTSLVKEKKLDPASFLASHDSYGFFESIGQLIKTGPTGTNVMDLRMFYIPGKL